MYLLPPRTWGKAGMGDCLHLDGVNQVGIAPIPTFPRRRGKEQFGEHLNESYHYATLH